MAKEKIKDIVERELSGFLDENGYELYNVEFVKEIKDWFLRVYIDKKEGSESPYVDTDDCEKVSRFLSDRLDALDPIEQNYYLEVSSPGMDRALLKERDYIRYAGQQVDVSLYKAFEGKKNYTGELLGLSDGVLRIKVNEAAKKGAKPKEKELEIPFEQVAKTKLAVIF